MFTFFFLLLSIGCIANLIVDLFGSTERIKNLLFWKKRITADETTLKQFRIHNIFLDITAIAIFLTFLFTRSALIMAVGGLVFFIQVVIMVIRFRKRL